MDVAGSEVVGHLEVESHQVVIRKMMGVTDQKGYIVAQHKLDCVTQRSTLRKVEEVLEGECKSNVLRHINGDSSCNTVVVIASLDFLPLCGLGMV